MPSPGREVLEELLLTALPSSNSSLNTSRSHLSISSFSFLEGHSTSALRHLEINTVTFFASSFPTYTQDQELRRHQEIGLNSNCRIFLVKRKPRFLKKQLLKCQDNHSHNLGFFFVCLFELQLTFFTYFEATLDILVFVYSLYIFEEKYRRCKF